MKVESESVQSGPPRHRRAVKRVLREAVLVAVAGAACAFAANQISPRGLTLTRNYFPEGTGRLVSATVLAGTNAPAPDPARLLAAELKAKGLQLADHNQVLQLFHDPRFQQNRVVFLDARDETHYRSGHIPGAYEFDPYHPEKYFDTVLPVCRAAEQIVVYCNGGDCDDSETAALLLRDIGIANQELVVYGGGITEWTASNLPVELGERNSGNLRSPGK
jgi:rhodanese-related sulfurtransferase